ncbi:restriction endonuclease subunit S [Aliarcobacter butzleri]|uniref:restriction endonuclease subunit S n=1 Tax=Aliarcobacter butzleri TaxID=28197 RepID=UPI002B24D973|nr:restriction endonuclease subunit S [Aliarcobacter butzleri]
MSSWKECKLGDFAEIKGGKRLPKGELLVTEKTPHPYIRITDFNGHKINLSAIQYVTEEVQKSISRYIVNKQDIIISNVGTIGLCAKIPDELDNANLTENCIKLVFDKNKIDTNFLYYHLISPDTQDLISGLDVGSTQPKLPIYNIEKIDISLPPLEEQKAIAEILSSLDDKIDLLHRQNQTLESLAQTLFRQWFIEEAKEEWEVGTLGEVIEIFDNKRIPLSKMERDKMKDGELYPYYGAAQIMDYVNDFIFDGEYILMGEDGTVRTDEGYPILQYATGKFWVNNHTHVIQAKEPYSNFFIWNYLAKKNIDEIVTGAVQPKINQGNLKSLDFPQYPLDLIQAFNEQSQAFFEKINQNKKQIQTLENLRDTLLPKLLSGEVRVKFDN